MIIAALIRTLSLCAILVYSESVLLWILISLIYGSTVTANAICVNHIMSKHIKTAKRGRSTSIINGMRRFESSIGPLYAGHIANFDISLLMTICVSLQSVFVVCCLMMPPNMSITNDHVNGSFLYFKHSFKATFGLKRLNINNWRRDRHQNAMRSGSDHQFGFVYVWRKYWKLVLFAAILGFGLNWVRITRKLILPFHGVELGLSKADIGDCCLWASSLA